jgi:hypothetical protein
MIFIQLQLVYQEHNMLETIRQQAPPAYEYLVGANGIAADKWRSTEWLRNKTLPPRFGIVSTNSLKSSTQCMKMRGIYRGCIVWIRF